jgi:hypothetical protein
MRILITIHAIAVIVAMAFTQAYASTVSGGSLILDINRNDLIAGVVLDKTPAPSIYAEEFFDASAASKTQLQILNDNTPTDLTDFAANEIPITNLEFAVNGANIATNPTGRRNMPTTFSFDPNNLLGTATGSIGLGGVIRFRVDVEPPSNRVIMGDMTLEYNPALEAATPGRSGWVLTNHIGFDIGAFNLFDVTTTLLGNNMTLNGNLGLGDGFNHLGGIGDTRVGTFTFQTTVVPVPAAVWLFMSGFSTLIFQSRTKRKSLS